MPGRTSLRWTTGSGLVLAPVNPILFRDTFETGNFKRWNSCQWNAGGSIRNDNCQTYSGSGEYSAQVANGGAGHEQAARFELRDGDIPFSTTERTEIAEAPIDVSAGDRRRMEWDMKFETSWPVPHASSGWTIVWQWHGSGPSSSPPLCLDIDTDDIVYVANNDSSERTAVQAVIRNQWQHWRIDAHFQPSSSGWAKVWVDDVLKVPQTSMNTMVVGEPTNYFKMGVYRDPVNVDTAIVWHDNFTVMSL